MKYRVGDVVKVRDDLRNSCYYMDDDHKGGPVLATPDMISFRGENVTIKEVIEYADPTDSYCWHTGYYIKEMGGRHLIWTDGMFECPAEQENNSAVELEPLAVLYDFL